MRFKTYTLTALCLLLSGVVLATPLTKIDSPYEITNKHLQTHVSFLSSDALEGRLTGSDGEKRAADYIAQKFLQLGLTPAGDHGTFFQTFHFSAGVVLGQHNALAITNQKGYTKPLILNQEWRPLSFSDTRSFKNTELVFAGFGISAPALGKLPAYNSYQGLHVKNKWVIIFRYLPENISAAESHQLQPYSSLRYKAFTAKEQGAKGIIFVNSPDIKTKNTLIPFAANTLLAGSGITALSMQNKVLDDLLRHSNPSFNSLQKLQQALHAHQLHAIPVLTGFKLVGFIDIEQKTQQSRNVLATLKINSHANQVIVIGAHLDHLGRGELSGSRARENETGMIHAGADDNASGVASVLEAAAKLSDMKAHGKLQGNKDILLAAWSGEEIGTLGSSHFVKNFVNTSIDAAINLDMIGHLREKLVLQGSGSSTEWRQIIQQTHTKHPLPLLTQNDPYLPTDSTAFYLHDVPILNFFTGAHDDYHTPRDKPETLNYTGMKNITDFLVDLVLALENKSGQLNYNAVQKAHNNTAREFNIYLGTIPDYTSNDVIGIKLSGTAKNSPADHAGLKSGDVIIELAGKKIHDIYDYTFALNALPVGKPIKLIAQRADKKIALTIVARYREERG